MQEKVSWRGSELAKVMDLPPAKLRMGAIFWVNHGTLQAFPCYTLIPVMRVNMLVTKKVMQLLSL